MTAPAAGASALATGDIYDGRVEGHNETRNLAGKSTYRVQVVSPGKWELTSKAVLDPPFGHVASGLMHAASVTEDRHFKRGRVPINRRYVNVRQRLVGDT